MQKRSAQSDAGKACSLSAAMFTVEGLRRVSTLEILSAGDELEKRSQVKGQKSTERTVIHQQDQTLFTHWY